MLCLIDNAPAHRSAIAMATIRDAEFEILEHPPYSADLACISDFYLFPKLKEYLREQRFKNYEAVVAPVQDFLGAQDAEFFKKGILSLEKIYYKFISVC